MTPTPKEVKHTPFRGHDTACHICGHTWDGAGVCPMHAAAPTLLEACEELVTAMVQLGKEHHREVAVARAAIAQARGVA